MMDEFSQGKAYFRSFVNAVASTLGLAVVAPLARTDRVMLTVFAPNVFLHGDDNLLADRWRASEPLHERYGHASVGNPFGPLASLGSPFGA